ncbi:MAG TPA: hypothetical protein VMW52_03600, partial [Phycisphaerae bacterium]|nr:hypothetical protein [Phycisphaerae bacterium]
KAPQITTKLAPAFRGLDLAKMGWREVGEALFKRASTMGDEVGDAARLFYRQYGIRGRHVFRVPFTQIKTPALKWGKQAARYRNLADMTPEGAAALRKLTAAQQVSSKAAAAVKQVQHPSVPIPMPGAGKSAMPAPMPRPPVAAAPKHPGTMELNEWAAAGRIQPDKTVTVYHVAGPERHGGKAAGIYVTTDLKFAGTFATPDSTLEMLRVPVSALKPSPEGARRGANLFAESIVQPGDVLNRWSAKPLSNTYEGVRREILKPREMFVRAAVAEGHDVPEAVLRPFHGQPWADAALAKIGTTAKQAAGRTPAVAAAGRPQSVPAEQLIQEYIASAAKGGKPVSAQLAEKLRKQIMDKGWQARGIGPLRPYFERANASMVAKATTAAQQADIGVIRARAAGDMPAAFRTFEKAAEGASYAQHGTWSQRAMYHLTRLFGRTPSPLRQKELAVYHGQTLGRAVADAKTRAAISPLLDDFAAKLAREGLADGKANEARRLIGFALDLGDPKNIKNLRPDHQKAVADMVRDLGLGPVFGRPEFQQLKGQLDELMAGWRRQTKQLGLEVGEVKGLGQYQRQVAPLTARQARQQALTAKTAEGTSRSVWQEWVHRSKPARTAMDTSVEDIKQLKAGGYKLSGRKWPVSGLEMEDIAQQTGMPYVVGRGVMKKGQPWYAM